MLTKFFRRQNKLQDVILGNGSLYLKCSAEYLTEVEEEGNTIIFPKGDETITLRITIFNFNSNDPNKKNKTGYDVVQSETSEDSQLKYYNDRIVNFTEESTEEDGTPLEMKFWKIGLKTNKLILISATILKSKQRDKLVKLMLESMDEIIQSIQPTHQETTIDTEVGEITYSNQKTNRISKEPEILTTENNIYLTKWKDNGQNIVRYYLPESNISELDLSTLDKVFELWLDDDKNKFDAKSIKFGLGALFGLLLNQHLDMNWVKVNDEYGEEFALRHSSSFTSFPFSSINKRIESGEVGFFEQIFQMLKHNLNNKNST